ncbi:hypothetical protein B9Z55_017424 [Caenorhabditis nigoni]|uniref:SCP domain-containing protein n=1 Tax=Caenorhabditis nigoni TaxID=1611254 RepID=A0A2G5T9M4_9PELO|nr:hypothetical protein B9Z55_017424 [Caenorhabditis nigoni]
MKLALCILAVFGFVSALLPDGKQAILDAHNKLRSDIAKGIFKSGIFIKPKAANMRKLRWDSALEASAQEEADRCQKDDRTQIGVNIYEAPTHENPDQVTKSWENEFQDRNWYGTMMGIHSFHSPMRHAIQMVWAETSSIGCGANTCGTRNEGYRTTYVCHYNEIGNKMYAEIYKTGETCSACSEGFKCETDTGLCDKIS